MGYRKIMNSKQIIIMWHVDDLKISHVNKDVVTKISNMIENQYDKDSYGNECPLTVFRGDTHSYLGMTFDYSKHGKVAADMTEYI